MIALPHVFTYFFSKIFSKVNSPENFWPRSAGPGQAIDHLDWMNLPRNLTDNQTRGCKPPRLGEIGTELHGMQ